jgi:transcription elongation factor Elf1
VCRKVESVPAACGGIPAGFPDNPRRDDQREKQKEAVMAESWSGEFYCVKCKEKREATGEIKVNDKGTKMAKAVCPVCGTNLNRILGKA